VKPGTQNLILAVFVLVLATLAAALMWWLGGAQ